MSVPVQPVVDQLEFVAVFGIMVIQVSSAMALAYVAYSGALYVVRAIGGMRSRG